MYSDKFVEVMERIVGFPVDGNEQLIYRGEPQCCYDEISSSLWRIYKGCNRHDDFSIEGIQKERINKAKRHLPTIQNQNDFEILSYLQHYGDKTNLIDFTCDY